MLILYNPKGSPVSVQYIFGARSYKKEILPLHAVSISHLSSSKQIKNLKSIISQRVTIYDYTNDSYVNNDSSFQRRSYNGETTMSGMTFSVLHNSTSTGWTFTTQTATTIANNTASATTAGNDVTIKVSGDVTTSVWYTAVLATSFSGFTNISVIGTSSSVYVLSAGTSQSFTLSADTQTITNLKGFAFVGDDVKRSQYNYVRPHLNELSTGFSSINTLATNYRFKS